MTERRKIELKLVEAEYGDIDAAPGLDYFIVRRWRLPSGWNKTETRLLVFIPPGYAVTPPDNFYVDNDLRTSAGQQPGNSSTNQTVLGEQWLLFSYHLEGGWEPAANPLEGHNLLTFLHAVNKRLNEVN